MGQFKNSPLRDTCTKHAGIHKDVHDKSAALDHERMEVACLRQDIIDEYEKKSAELLEYLNSMECAFDHQRLEYEDRESVLKQENAKLKRELEYGCRAHMAEHIVKDKEREKKTREVHQALQVLKCETKEQEKLARKEHKRVKELQGMVDDLQLELEKKEEEHQSCKKRDDRVRKRIENENHELRRKAALGWMLGCLSELYLRLDPEIGTGGIMKLVRKVQRELECGNHVFSTGGMPPKLEYELIQREIRRLINRAEASTTTPLRGRSVEKLGCAMLRSEKQPAEFTGELPGERRRRLCRSKALREQEAAIRPSTAPSDLCRQPQRDATSCQHFVVNCVDQKHKPRNCYVTCHPHQCSQMELSKEKRCKHETMLSPTKKPPGTWAEVRLIDADEANRAASQSSYAEIKKMLTGLESSMTYLLGQERRRRLQGNGRLPNTTVFKPQ